MSVFNLLTLFGVGAIGSMNESLKRVAITKDSILKKQARERGSEFYYKDGKFYDINFGLELKETIIPGYRPFFTAVASDDFVVGFYENDIYETAHRNAKRMNKKYFIVNRMNYIHRHLYNEKIKFYIVTTHFPTEVYAISRYDKKCDYYNLNNNIGEFEYITVKYVYQNTIEKVVSPIESFPTTKKWLTEILENSYITDDSYIDRHMWLVDGLLFNLDDYNQKYFLHLMNNNEPIDIFWDTIHGCYNRKKIEKIIQFLTTDYNNEIIHNSINMLKQIILEERIYYEKSNKNRQKLIYATLQRIENDCNMLKDYTCNVVEFVVNDLSDIIYLEGK